MNLNRRHFLQTALAAGATTLLPFPLSFLHRAALAATRPSAIDALPAGFDPILPLGSFASTAEFTGDEPDRIHQMLWDKTHYLSDRGGLPPITETARVVIVGGGIAGLTAAYHLRDQNPILLDAASRPGGNAKGESVQDQAFSIGAAYIATPDPGSPTHNLLTELGIWNDFRQEADSESAYDLGNTRVRDFWNGSTDPSCAHLFREARAKFTDVYENAFPEIPGAPHELDSLTFRQWLNQELPNLHPHVEEFIELYCWSSFGGTTDELSAAQGLNFVTADLNGIMVAPGGNSHVARNLVKALVASTGPQNLRTNSPVIDVRPMEQGVRVTYETPDGKLKAIHARACVVATPKFAARAVVDGLPNTQLEAMGKIKYRSYLMANVLLKQAPPITGYDVFRLEGKTPRDPKQDLRKRICVDGASSHFATQNPQAPGSITFYQPLPYDGTRSFLFGPVAHDREKERTEKSLMEALKPWGLIPDHVAGIRMTRWGHAFPLAARGLLANGTLESAHAPFAEGHIQFANQDCWANPAIETAIGRGIDVAQQLRRFL